MIRRPHGGESGFTLIETVLTLSIVTILLGIVLASLRLGVRSWEKGESAVEISASKRSIISKLESEISSMYPWLQKEGQAKKYLFSGRKDSLGFVTVSRKGSVDIPWGGAKWVYYCVDDSGLTVREKTVPSADVKKDEGGKLTVFDKDVSELNFEYKRDGGWEESWDTDEKKGLPWAVKARLSFKDRRPAIVATFRPGLKEHSEKNPSH